MLGFQAWLPNAYAAACQLQIANIEYPSSASPIQSFDVTAHLKLTCAPVNQNVLARVDVVSPDTNRTLSTNSQGIGEIHILTPPYFQVVNVTIKNTVQAPSSAGNWRLRVVAWVFTGPDVNDVANQLILIQVGAANPTTTTSNTQTTQTSVSTSASTSSFGNLGIVGAVGVAVAVGLIGLVMMMKRRKPQTAVLKQEVSRSEAKPETPRPKPETNRLQ